MRRWLYGGLAAIAGVEAAAPRVLYHDHAHFWFENVPAWGSFYGLVSCVLIIEVSKLVGRVWLMRPETYYDAASGAGELDRHARTGKERD